MQRIQPLDPNQATPEQQATFATIQSKFGGILNIFKTMNQSPAAVNTYLGIGQALADGTLTPAFREQIAITVAEENACEYCLSAHTYIGKSLGLTPEELETAREARSNDPKTQAGLEFARQIVAKRGMVSDEDIADLRNAGYSDGQAVEILAVVVHNIFTNYFNHLADTEVDLPKVTPKAFANA